MHRRRVATAVVMGALSLGMAVPACTDLASDPSGEARRAYTEAAVRVRGTSESLAQVLDLEVASDGSVWLLNSVEPYFVRLDPAGSVTREHGSQGGGPEEYLLPAGFVSGGLGDSTWVFDARRHALINVSAPAGDRAEVALPVDLIPPGSVVTGMSLLRPTVRIARLGSDIVIPRTTGSLQDGLFSLRLAILQADMFLLDPSSGSARLMVGLAEVLDDPSTGFELTDGGFPFWYRLWDVCGPEEIRVYDRTRHELRTFRSDGSEAGGIRLPPPVFTEASPREFAGAIFEFRAAEIVGNVVGSLSSDDSLRVINEIVGEVNGNPRELASYLPRYVDMRCSEDGTTWLRPLSLDRGAMRGTRYWLRVSTDGSTETVDFPERFDPLRFTSGRVWGVLRDAFDVPSVGWIDLTAP